MANSVPVWWDEQAAGATNMGADEALVAEAVARGILLVRLYGWQPAAVSLGAFQRLDDARQCSGIASLPVVRRPSGGGAIIHGSDLTYAAAVPKHHPWGSSPQRLYDAFHGAMVKALADWKIVASLHPAGGPAAPAAASDQDPFLCFDRRAVGDVVMPDRRAGRERAAPVKVMGSAQRRLEGAVLQHGSLLLTANAAASGSAQHPGIQELAGDGVEIPAIRDLVSRWLELVATSLGARVAVQTGSFAGAARSEVDRLAERFGQVRWTARR